MVKLQFFFIAVLSGCSNTVQINLQDNEKVVPNFLQQTLYYGGDIITMQGDRPEYVEAVMERDGKIIYVGDKASAVGNFAGETIEVDLKGKTMLPGFIEPHAHPASIGAFILANDIVAPHEWRMPHKTYPGVSGKENYLKAVSDIIDSKKDKSNTVLIWGYHKSWHGELTLKDLDRVTGNVPTIIWQRSTHEIYLNTASARKYGLKKGDLTAADDKQADWVNYHFWERAYQMLKGTKLALFFGDKEMLRRGMDRISTMMLKNGLTAMTEPGFPTSAFEDEYAILKEGTEKAKAYTIYLISGFPEQFVKKVGNDVYAAHIESLPEQYNTEYIKFLPKQYKTFADGAIYSLALELREPFYNCPDCKPEWIIPLKEGKQIFDFWWDKGYKIHIHITGDLAFEKYLDMVERAMQRNPRKDHRTTFHHVGLFGAGQAQRAADLDVEISANPYYLWALADKYSETGLGPERAANLVALKELTKRGVPVSLHSDFAMAPAEPLLLVWVATNRIVASGQTMTPEESISVYEAVKGITITAARTFEMEHEIGSIKVGKQATFTLLEQNPFKIDPAKIKDIPIAGIVYKGRMKLNKDKFVGADRDAHGCIGSAGYSWCVPQPNVNFPGSLPRKMVLKTNERSLMNFVKIQPSRRCISTCL
jgi:predicted amidohydrolase YtcJ